MKILVIEDDPFVAEALAAVLANQNYVVEVASDGQQGWEWIQAFPYDLILLDIMLPKLDGITICRNLRSQGMQTPVLLLTARDSSHDKAVGLDAGADDYVVKPFDTEELVARVRALLRRSSEANQPILRWGSLHLDPSSCEVSYDGKGISVTPKEYALLELFMRNPKRVFSCSAILDHLWAYEEAPGEEAVRTHIKGLRQKLKKSGITQEVIETVYGIGYRLKPKDSIEFADQRKSRSQEIPTPSSSQAQTLMLIEQVWQRHKQRVFEQVQGIQAAIVALQEPSTLAAELLTQAIQEAHTLAGSLGMFGFAQGSQIARQIEMRLPKQPTRLDPGHLQDLAHLLAALQAELIQTAPKSTPPDDRLMEDRPMLLIVSKEEAFLQPVSAAAIAAGFQITLATQFQAARRQLQQQIPAIVLFDLDIHSNHNLSFQLLSGLHQQKPPVPVVVLASQSDLQERLQASRSGAQAFLPKPAEAAEVIAVVQQVLEVAERSKSHILVVDDDPAVLTIVQALLKPWGLRVTMLQDATQFWTVLEESAPDLLILDIVMPGVNGIELCQTVRSDPHWNNLPVIFLTAHQDVDTVNQVFRSGGDDFISKPILGPELVTRVVNRLERTKQLQRSHRSA